MTFLLWFITVTLFSTLISRHLMQCSLGYAVHHCINLALFVYSILQRHGNRNSCSSKPTLTTKTPLSLIRTSKKIFIKVVQIIPLNKEKRLNSIKLQNINWPLYQARLKVSTPNWSRQAPKESNSHEDEVYHCSWRDYTFIQKGKNRYPQDNSIRYGESSKIPYIK